MILLPGVSKKQRSSGLSIGLDAPTVVLRGLRSRESATCYSRHPPSFSKAENFDLSDLSNPTRDDGRWHLTKYVADGSVDVTQSHFRMAFRGQEAAPP